MNRQPMTFGDLASRLSPTPSPEVRCCGPLMATIRPHRDVSQGEHANGESSHDENSYEDDANGYDACRRPARARRAAWAVLHSISDWDVRMIHAQPLSGAHLDVEIHSPSGETLRFVLSIGGSKKSGQLYETAAKVVRSGWTHFPYPLAS